MGALFLYTLGGHFRGLLLRDAAALGYGRVMGRSFE